MRSSASSFNFQHLHFSLRSSSSCLHLLPGLTALMFPSITYFRRQFLRKMCPIQLAFLLFIVCGIFLSSLTLCNTSSFLTRSVQLIFYSFLQHHISNLSSLQVLRQPSDSSTSSEHFAAELQFFGLLTAEARVLFQDSSRSICGEKWNCQHFYCKLMFSPVNYSSINDQTHSSGVWKMGPLHYAVTQSQLGTTE